MTKETMLQHEAAEYMARMEITEEEHRELLDWVRGGRSVFDNPWYMADENGQLMDYISAMREAHDHPNTQ